MSLRSRIASVAALLVAAAILVSSLLQTLAARRAVLEQVRVGGESIAEVLARTVASVELAPEADDPARLTRSAALQRLLAEIAGGDILEIRVLDPQLATVAERRGGDGAAGALGQRDVELARDAIATQPLTPAEFARFVDAEIAVWGPVAKASGAQPE